jgi:ATP-dependent RNA helicase DDX3X
MSGMPKMQHATPPMNPNNANGYGRQMHNFYEQPQQNQGYGYGNRGGNYGNRGGYHQNGYNQGGYGRNNYGGRGQQNRGGYRGDYQSHYRFDRNDRHSSFENKGTWDKSVFDNNNSAGINFDEYDKIEVNTENYDGFEPIPSFEEANLNEKVLKNIKLCGYEKPTPIQKYAIPIIMAERDVMACAQTGSGKTAAFLLPIINCMLANPKEEIGFHSRSVTYSRELFKKISSTHFEKCYPKALILSPTRELAQQIHKDCGKFLYSTNLGAGCIFGGSKVDKQLRFLASNRVDILVATVGRLWDFFERGKLSFEDVHYFILDEADNMLDMGFERQINMILYESDLPRDRLNLLFSATMPKEIQKLASDFLDNYVFLSFGMVGSVTTLVTQTFEQVEQHEKLEKLVETLQGISNERILVFTAMKRTADELEWRLRNESVGKVIAIHGDKSQRDRERALNGFRRGRFSVLIATDVAARGLDIKNVTYVIQYDLPGNVDSYVHRVGRTGRCGNKGNAIAFVNAGNKNILRPLLEQLAKEGLDIPQWLMDLNRRVNRGGGRNYGKKRYGYKRGNNKRYNNRNKGW